MLGSQISDGIIYTLNLSPNQGFKMSRYLTKEYRNSKNYKDLPRPAPAMSRQWELKNTNLHEQVLDNNSTVGVNLFSQNFYLNPNYKRTAIQIEPGKHIDLEDIIFFEPRSFASEMDEM